MKAIITVNFKKINNFTVDEKLSNDKNLQEATKVTVSKVCNVMEKYFQDHKIKTKIGFTLEP